MEKLPAYLSRQTKSRLLVFAFALTIILGGIDYLTGPEISFAIFYLIPIALSVWFTGREYGIIVSLTSTVAWLLADLLTGKHYSRSTIPFWNAGVRFGFFLIITCVLSALKNAQERQEELGHFIVHDLRSPLSNVVTGLQTLQDISGETMNPTELNLVDMCLVSCGRMLTLINSLLDLAQLESGKMPLQMQDISTDELIESALKQVSVWATRNRVSLDAAIEVNAVYTDATVTMRVLVNLLSNAIKFSPPETTVTVSATPFAGEMVAFSVTDQGRGISKEWADKVFDKFVQVEARRAGSTVGTGLGLTFCRLAVEAQGGRIWLDSEIDKGTTVTFTLPARHK